MSSVRCETQYDLDQLNIGDAVLEDAPDALAANDLAWRFFGLGNLTGKTLAEIISQVGLPSSTYTANEGAFLEWETAGYHIGLLFDAQERVVRVGIESALA